MLPGPGSYKQLDIVGNTRETRAQSHFKTPVANAFARASNRFFVPSNPFSIYSIYFFTALKEKSPGPGTHSPKTDFVQYNTTSTHKFIGQTAFGRDERRALEDKHKLFKDVPGPGSYYQLGDFGKYLIENGKSQQLA